MPSHAVVNLSVCHHYPSTQFWPHLKRQQCPGICPDPRHRNKFQNLRHFEICQLPDRHLYILQNIPSLHIKSLPSKFTGHTGENRKACFKCISESAWISFTTKGTVNLSSVVTPPASLLTIVFSVRGRGTSSHDLAEITETPAPVSTTKFKVCPCTSIG